MKNIELPKGWRWEKISTIAPVNPKRPRKVPANKTEGTSFVPMECIDDAKGEISNFFLKPYNELSTSYTYFEEGDILFAKITPCMENGNCAIVQGLPGGFGFGSSEYIVLKPKNDILGRWVYYLLRTKELRKYAEENFTGSAGQKRVPPDLIKNYHIPVNDDLEVINKLNNEIYKRQIATEQMRQAALQQKEAVEALQQKQLDEILSLSKFKKLKFKKLKEFNPEISAGKAVSSVGGYYTPDGIPYLQVNNIDNERGFIPNKIIYISEESHLALIKSEVIKGDVLINIVGPPIGKICWYPNEQPANINQAVVRIRCPKEINFKFLTYLLRTSHFYNHFVEVKVGSRQWNVSSTNIGDLSIPEIDIDKQLELVKEIESKNITHLKTEIIKQLEAIEALPAAILREVFEFKTIKN